jgi:outer membrane lipoprotein-sorting protein
MKMKTWSYGTDYSMTLITSPAKEKGIGFLKREKEVWNWVPSVEKLIKLPPSMMMQSWMGTDFTNDDLVKQSSIVDDYDHKILGDSTIEGRKCWKIEMIPHEDAAVVWGKVVVWIDQQDYVQMKVKSYDEDGFLVSTLNASEVKNLGGRIMATRLEMIPADKEGHKTVFIQNSMEFDLEELNPDFFTPQNLKRIRL